MRISLTLLLVLAIVIPIFGGKKILNRNWQTGNLIDVRRSQDFAGTVERPGVVLTNGRRITNDSTKAVYRTQQTFVIETDTHQNTRLQRS